MRLKISNNYSPNFSIPKRKTKMIKFIVIHYTGMKKENAAINNLVIDILILSPDFIWLTRSCLIFSINIIF